MRIGNLAIIHFAGAWQIGLDFISDASDFIQVGTWSYDSTKELPAHRHVPNVRTIDRTQEAVYVVSGCIEVVLFEDGMSEYSMTVKLFSGDLCVLLSGGHGYEVLENNTRVIEFKNGPFTTVEKDKELI